MRKRRHKSPSRIRYEKKHPVVSFRVKKEWYNEFKAYLKEQNISIGDFFRIALGKQKADYQKAYEKGFDEGYKAGYDEGYSFGKKEWGIQFPCCICNQMMYIQPNSDCHKAVIEFLISHLWAHSECSTK